MKKKKLILPVVKMVPGAVLRVEAVAGVVAAPGCTVVADHSGQVILTLQHISVGYVYYIQYLH